LSFLEHPNPNISYLVTACSVFAIPGVITSRCERILFESDKSTKDSLLHQKALLKKDEKLFEDSLQTLKIALRDGFDYDNFLSLYGDFKLLHSETQSEAQFCRELLLLLYSICRSLYMKKLHANYDFTLLIKENLESELSSLSFNDLSTLIERYELTLPTLNSFTFLDALNFIESVLGDKKSKTMI
jgi:hypothetical protein